MNQGEKNNYSVRPYFRPLQSAIELHDKCVVPSDSQRLPPMSMALLIGVEEQMAPAVIG